MQVMNQWMLTTLIMQRFTLEQRVNYNWYLGTLAHNRVLRSVDPYAPAYI
jgi:hypothetical protein